MRPAFAHPDCIILMVKHDDSVISRCRRDKTKEFTSVAEQLLRVFLKSSFINSRISDDAPVALDQVQVGFDFFTCMKLLMQSSGFCDGEHCALPLMMSIPFGKKILSSKSLAARTWPLQPSIINAARNPYVSLNLCCAGRVNVDVTVAAGSSIRKS